MPWRLHSSGRAWRMGPLRRRRGRSEGETGGSPLWAAGWIVLVALSALALVWPHLEMVKIGYEVARLKAERDRLAQERRVLRIESAALRQLGRIEAIARKELGMVFPRPEQVIYVKVLPN